MARRTLVSFALLAFLLAGIVVAADKPADTKGDEKKTEKKRRPSDVVFILIETSEIDTDSVDELQTLYDVLRKVDKNKDGKLDADELKAARLQIVTDRIDHIFGDLDTNKDGKISKDEAKGRIKENFDKLDTNKDGFVDRDELMKAITEHAKVVKDRENPDKK
jgi:Ca2+-binding EF-hand superfamily protein